jgi:hypothetical protein
MNLDLKKLLLFLFLFVFESSEFEIPLESLPLIKPSCSNFCNIAFEPLRGIPITAVLGD